MLKRYFFGGLVLTALLCGCSTDSYTTTDTAQTRTATTRAEDAPGASVDTSADGNPQTGQGSVSVSLAGSPGASPGASGSASPGNHTSSLDADGGTPSTYGQSYDSEVADNNSGTTAQTKGVADTTFATEAAKGGMKEVQLGRLASEKASNAEVKMFAQQMVADHGKANEELKKLAQQKGLTLPGADSKNANVHSQLSTLSGAQFDKQYVDMMVTDHQKTVALFETESQRGQDQQLKSWAAEKLPTLQHHLKMAQDLQASLSK